jgi:hypothetical protein
MATQASEQLAVRVCDGTISAARKRTSSLHSCEDSVATSQPSNRMSGAAPCLSFPLPELRSGNAHLGDIPSKRRLFSGARARPKR